MEKSVDAARSVDKSGDPRALKALLAARDFPALLRATDPAGEHPPAERWLYRGKALEGLLQAAAAADCYRDGLRHWPRTAALHLALGQLAVARGEREPALAALERARDLDPDSLDCYAALLHLVPLAPDGPEAARILARARDYRRSDASRARALFLLGQLQVEAGRDRTGFRYYAAGNRLSADSLDRRKREYRLADRLFRMREATFATAARSLPPCNAVLVTGLPRSGKSLVESLLAAHPAVNAGGEFAGLRRAVVGTPAAKLPALPGKAAASTRSPFIEAYREHPRAVSDGRWLVDSSPANLPRLGDFALLHPETPIVLCRRRAADLGLALYFKKFRTGHGYSYNLATAGRAIARAERLMAHWQAALPNPVLVVHYEDLVREPEAMRARLYAHLGLASPDNVTDLTSADSWRLFPSRSPGAGAPLDPSLIGFADRFTDELTPLVAAYEAERA